MSRDIKFRAWYRYGRKMAEVEVMLFTQPNIGLQLKGGDSLQYLAVNENVELMQCTGLKDKNGRDIYEGDIVYSDRYNARFEVKWCNGKGEFLRSQVGWMLDDTRFCPVGHTVEFEAHLEVHEADREEYFNGRVIGNIYEHPELIERKSHEVG